MSKHIQQRQQQINELIKQELSKIILKEIEFPQEVLVTLTKVETSPDFKNSNIYVSIMSIINLKNKNKNKLDVGKHRNFGIIEMLNRNIYTIQQKLNKILRIRLIPKIKFLEEKTIYQAARIEEILEKLKK